MRVTYETGPRPREDLLRQRTPGEHVWLAMAAFRVSGANLRGPRLNLDRENLATIEVGCWVCEQGYDPAVAGRPCPGEPGPEVPEARP